MFAIRRSTTSMCVLLSMGIITLPSVVAQPPVATAQVASSRTASLVQMIDTSQWNPPSPDPSGIAYWPAHDTLVVVDGEVEETPYYQGANVFEATRTGELRKTYDTLILTPNWPKRDPVGIEIVVNPENNHFFIVDDNKKRVFEIDLGPDGQFATSDDDVDSFSTTAFGSTDPEGITYGQGSLFIADGVGTEVYRVDPGPNGRFDGVPAEGKGGDDQVTQFDTATLGQPDPEGVEFDPKRNTLYLISNKQKSGITEVTTSGQLVSTIDISSLKVMSPGDLTLAPSSQNPAVNNLYIVDRGVDNMTDPNENDGKIYEIKIDQDGPERVFVYIPLVQK